MFSNRIWVCWDLSRIFLASSRKLGLMVANRFNMGKLVKWWKSRTEHCNFTNKFTMHDFWQESGSERKFWELTVCNSYYTCKTKHQECLCLVGRISNPYGLAFDAVVVFGGVFWLFIFIQTFLAILGHMSTIFFYEFSGEGSELTNFFPKFSS